ITMSLIIPLATLLIGYAANYSQELENEVPLRFRLFGFREQSMLGAKMIANLIFMTIALAIYTVADYLLLDIQVPQLSSALILIAALYVLAVILFVLAHAIASLTGKFGPTYGITMTLYFGFMVICGMMGVSVDRLPEGLQAVANALPMTYISRDFAGFWQGGSYDFTPLLLSFLLLGVIACAFLFASIWKNKRKIS
ncbi:MAG: ABC transporter permease, partial [Christensenella sp.]|uniref:ABC transporter permease n=1 Tax=Christensenella sp. TaxID=1935934 RepID=UPI002B1EA775